MVVLHVILVQHACTACYFCCLFELSSVVVCSAIFIRTNAISNLLWKFQRYILVLEYEARPILPPPLVIFCHVYLLGKYIRRKCQGKRKFLDNGLSKYCMTQIKTL